MKIIDGEQGVKHMRRDKCRGRKTKKTEHGEKKNKKPCRNRGCQLHNNLTRVFVVFFTGGWRPVSQVEPLLLLTVKDSHLNGPLSAALFVLPNSLIITDTVNHWQCHVYFFCFLRMKNRLMVIYRCTYVRTLIFIFSDQFISTPLSNPRWSSDWLVQGLHTVWSI